MCAREWWPACWLVDAGLAASVSRGMRAAAGTLHRGWLSVAAGSPGRRAGSRAGTRRAGITGASANSCLSGLESETGSGQAQRRPPISRLERIQKQTCLSFPVCRLNRSWKRRLRYRSIRFGNKREIISRNIILVMQFWKLEAKVNNNKSLKKGNQTYLLIFIPSKNNISKRSTRTNPTNWGERDNGRRNGRKGERRQSESPRADARKTIMMDKLRLVPHVRSERKTTGGNAVDRGEKRPRKGGSALLCRPVEGREEEQEKGEEKRKGEREEWNKEGRRQEECRRVYRSIPPFYGVPLHSCRYAAHPRISSPLGSHVIERSPSRGETQPIHILCSPPVHPEERKNHPWGEGDGANRRERG